MAKPLTELLPKQTKWSWGEEHQQAFDKIKEALVSSPVMGFPDPNKTFVIATDASKDQIGAVILQESEEKESLRAIAYASRVLTTGEQRFSVPEKECLAMVWAIRYFHHYISRTRFVVSTDHRCLLWLGRHQDQNSRLMKWALFLQPYDFVVIYGKGADNVVADCLSRMKTGIPLQKEDSKELIHPELVEEDLEPLTLPITMDDEKERWIGRVVEVQGAYFGARWARENHAKLKRFRMMIVKREMSDEAGSRWIVRLPKEDGGEEFSMNEGAIRHYILPLGSVIHGTVENEDQILRVVANEGQEPDTILEPTDQNLGEVPRFTDLPTAEDEEEKEAVTSKLSDHVDPRTLPERSVLIKAQREEEEFDS
jgi:hypothetical protein